MAEIKEGRYASDWLKREADSHFSREEIIVASGSGKVLSGTVLGKITASGKYKPVTVAATDGSQNAAAILLHAVDATAADAPGVSISRDAIVVQQGLLYGADVDTAAERLAVQNALRALNPPILPREGA
ncbi:head decoration protein [Neorhizobium sp. DAR64872/K0K18]|uniref:head decoration protein n=1 Tax=Neorhizobium sp. DAR64872/K0K18 TaxID=3421958 RepID=UPI003D29BFB2